MLVQDITFFYKKNDGAERDITRREKWQDLRSRKSRMKISLLWKI